MPINLVCLIFEMHLMRKKKPKFNTQSDSIRAKVLLSEIVPWHLCECCDVVEEKLGNLSKHDVDRNENAIWKCNFGFLQSFRNCLSHLACQMFSNYPGNKSEQALQW